MVFRIQWFIIVFKYTHPLQATATIQQSDTHLSNFFEFDSYDNVMCLKFVMLKIFYNIIYDVLCLYFEVIFFI